MSVAIELEKLKKLRDSGAITPAVTTSKATYIPNEAILVNFTNAPGNAHDWIGIFPAAAPNTGRRASGGVTIFTRP